MKTSIYEAELLEKATSTGSLEVRLQVNSQYSSTNFNDWLMARLQVAPGEDILDVGCGTGAQTIPFAKLVGPAGSVSAMDLSQDSITSLLEQAGNLDNVEAVAGDMADLDAIIKNQFTTKKFDLAHSSYALYYTRDRHRVLDAMREALKEDGRLAIFTPNDPHGMVNFVKRWAKVPAQVEDCFKFGPAVLEPYFREHFWDVSIFLFHNVLRIPRTEEVMKFYRSTTYYDPATEQDVAAEVERQIDAKGYFEYEKNGYLIIGARPLTTAR
jgi:ubiquinone/menaquinone biosynthesis C-methylase UbiE